MTDGDKHMEIAEEKRKKGFINSFTLKTIAIIAMIIDHIGYTLIPYNHPVYEPTRCIGRIAFPIFCFLIVEGFHHSHSQFNYLMRLLIFAFLSEIPYDLAFSGKFFDFSDQNVFFTLAIGLAMIFCIEEYRSSRLYAIPMMLLFLAATFLKCDYGAGGVLLIIVFYLTENSLPLRLLLATAVLYVFCGGIDESGNIAREMWGVIALIPISFYNGKRGPGYKWIFYFIYPVHLLILFGLKMALR